MTYAIKIAHPNQLKDRTVGRVSSEDEVADHLSSPTFEYYDGMIVKVILESNVNTVFYRGVYMGQQVIDLSAQGHWMKSIHNDAKTAFSNGQYRVQVPHKDFISAWTHAEDPTWMVYALRNKMPDKIIHQTLSLCARRALSYTERVDPNAWDALEVFEQWLEDDNRDFGLLMDAKVFAQKAFDVMADRSNYGTDISTPRGSAAYAMLMVVQGRISSIEYVIPSAIAHRNVAEFGNVVRSKISLYDALLALGNFYL